ncbi:MAG: ATP-binding protein [Acidimicrobiales bacterium]
MPDLIELEIPARPEYAALVRLVVSSLAGARRELSDERLDDLKLAVSEACTNAIEAHGAIATGDRVVLRCAERDDRLIVAVEDRGSGFDPAALPPHPPVTDPDRLNFERGLGLPLIRSLVDEVDIESSAGGTRVRLVVLCGPSGPAEPGYADVEELLDGPEGLHP